MEGWRVISDENQQTIPVEVKGLQHVGPVIVLLCHDQFELCGEREPEIDVDR